MLLSDNWPYPYTREKAAYPTDWVKQNKFWVSVARVDDAYGTLPVVKLSFRLTSYCDRGFEPCVLLPSYGVLPG
jgi:glycine dehydrogenase